MDHEITPRDWQLPDRYGIRLLIAVTFSLLFHVFILSLQFGVFGLGLPGLQLPWNERRAQVSELSIRLTNVNRTPALPDNSEQAKPELTPPMAEPKVVKKFSPSISPSAPQPHPEASFATPSPAAARVQPQAVPEVQSLAPPHQDTQTVKAIEKPIPKIEKINPPEPQLPPQEKSQPKVINKLDARPDTFSVPPPTPAAAEPQQPIAPKIETPIQSAEISESKKSEELDAQIKVQAEATQKLAEENAMRDRERESRNQEEAHAANVKRHALELEAKKQTELAAAAALALQKQEQAAQKARDEEAMRRAQQLEALKLEEAKKQEQAKLELAKSEQLKLEQEKLEQDKLKRLAMELETKRQAEEVARQRTLALERQKQAEDLAIKAQEQQKVEELAERKKLEAAVAQQQRERAAAENPATAARNAENHKPVDVAALTKNFSGSDLAGKAMEQVRKLDMRSIESQPVRPSSNTTDNARRRSIFGKIDKDIDLSMYIESWRLKIERNGRLNYKQPSTEKAEKANIDSLVTVALRSDGSVEEIIINRSSGRLELDEAVRRIVRLNARYSVFPPNLAREYDVIEIRRVWSFDDTLKILDEGR